MSLPRQQKPDQIDERTRRIAFTDGSHRWSIVYTLGDERAAIERVMQLARDENAPLGWAPAVIAAHSIAKSRTQSTTPAGVNNE